MIQHINRAEIIGRVGRVEVTDVPGGEKEIRLLVATSHACKAEDGCPAIETTWHRVTARDSENRHVEDIGKGDTVHVVGRLRAIRYVRSDGAEAMTYEIAADSVETVTESQEE